MAGTTHYFFECMDPDAVLWRVEIKDTTYAGPDEIDFTGLTGGDGFTFNTPETDNLIKASDFECSIDLGTDSLALFDAIIAGPDCRFIVLIYKAGAIFWRGFISQDSMSKPDAGNGTAFLKLTATDGFGLLKDILYTGYDIDNLVRYNYPQWMQIIAAYLPLNYDSINTNVFSFASVWYEDSMDSSVVSEPEYSNPLASTYINESAFLQVDEYGVTEAANLYDILNALLSEKNLQLSQCNGVYLFIQENTFIQSQTRAWSYDKAGTFQSSALLGLQSAIPVRFSGGSYTYILPVKQVTTEYEYRHGIFRNNLFPYNVDEGYDYLLGLSIEGADMNFSGSMSTKVTSDTASNGEFVAIYKLSISCGSYYLLQSGSAFVWSLTPGTIRVRDFNSVFSTIVGTVESISSFSFAVPALPSEGESIEFRWEFLQFESYLNENTAIVIPGTNTYEYDDIEGTFKASINSGVPMEGKQLFKATVANSARADIELDSVGLGDGVNKYSAGALYVRNTSDVIVESNAWTIYSEIGGTAYPVNSLRCRESLAQNRNTIEVYNGTLKGSPDFHKALTFDGKQYVLKSISWDCFAGEYSFTAFVINPVRTGITVDAVLTAQDETAGNTSAGSGSNGTTPEPTAENFWSRDETNTEVYPLNIADKIAGYDSITSKDLLGNNYSSINLGDFTQQKENTISNQSRYVSDSELSNGVNLFSRVVAFSKSNIYSQFREAINTAEAWTTSSRAVEWIIETVVSGATTLSRRLRIDKDGYFYIGSSTNNTSFSPSGTQRMNGSATVWNDLNIPGLSVQFAGANDPALSDFGSTTKILSFSGATMKEVFFTVQLPHSYKEGSAIEPHVHWCPLVSPASSLGVRWGLDYQWQNNAGVYSATDSTVLATGSTGTVGYTHLITSFGTISGTGKTISSILVCRLYRLPSDAADTYTGDAGLLSIDFHYESDSLGSETEYGK